MINSSHIDERLKIKDHRSIPFCRDVAERVDKAMSIYENVDGANSTVPPTKPNESTVWYEYGCV